MVLQHDIEKIVLVNDRIVEITINQDAIESKRYDAYLKKSKGFLSGAGKSGPQFEFEITPSYDRLTLLCWS